MAYTWTADLAPGAEAEVDDLADLAIGRQFDTQQAAEQWLTASYQDLADAGVSHVSLFEEDRLVYGPMSLEA